MSWHVVGEVATTRCVVLSSFASISVIICSAARAAIFVAMLRSNGDGQPPCCVCPATCTRLGHCHAPKTLTRVVKRPLLSSVKRRWMKSDV